MIPPPPYENSKKDIAKELKKLDSEDLEKWVFLFKMIKLVF